LVLPRWQNLNGNKRHVDEIVIVLQIFRGLSEVAEANSTRKGWTARTIRSGRQEEDDLAA